VGVLMIAAFIQQVKQACSSMVETTYANRVQVIMKGSFQAIQCNL